MIEVSEEKSDQSESSPEEEIEYVVVDGIVEKYPKYDFMNVIETDERMKQLYDLFKDGWKLDRQFSDNPLPTLDGHSLIYFLIKMDPKLKAEKPMGAFDDVESLRSVPNDEVDSLLKEGYVIHTIYAKNTILIKRRKPSDPILIGKDSIHIDRIDLPKEEKNGTEQKIDKKIYR